MRHFDFQVFERFEEQVDRARELFHATEKGPRRAELMGILASAERALEDHRRHIGLDAGRTEPQPWWAEWRLKRANHRDR